MKKTVMIIIVFTIAFPVILVMLFSFFSFYRFPLIFPIHFSLDIWKNMITNSRLYTSVLSSFFVGILNGGLATIVGIFTARVLVRYQFLGKKVVSVLFSLPLFIPAIAMFLGVHLVMTKIGLINSLFGVVIAHMLISIPYSTSIFISFFQGINPDTENVAKMMGCSNFELVKRILLPLLAPGIYLSFSISFLISFSEYFSTFLIGGGKILTVSSMMYPYVYNGDTGNAAVLGVLFIFVNISVFFVADVLSRKKLRIDNYLFE